jgi:hypothetical protein
VTVGVGLVLVRPDAGDVGTLGRWLNGEVDVECEESTAGCDSH